MKKHMISDDTKLDVAFYSYAFEGKKLEEIVLAAQKGDKASKEEFYMRMNGCINQMAGAFCIQYRNCENDEAEFFSRIFQASEKCLLKYNPEKGQFLHFWRRAMVNERKHFYRHLSSGAHIEENSVEVDASPENPDLLDYLVCLHEGTEKEESYKEKKENQEVYEKIMAFCQKKFSPLDVNILSLWLESEKLADIAASLKTNKRHVVTRIYRILKIIRNNFTKIVGTRLYYPDKNLSPRCFQTLKAV